MTRKTFAQRLDDSVRWTGIPQMTLQAPRRRPLRGLSTLALALASAGAIMGIGWPQLHWVGYAVLMVGFSVANFMPIWGPLKPWASVVEPIDERERAVRARASLIALSVVTFVTVVGLWAIVGLSALGNWDGNTLRMAIIQLGFYIAALYTAGPTCIASWSERPPVGDDE